MADRRPVKSALLSVYSKEGLEPLVRLLRQHDVRLFSTGGTQQYLEKLGLDVEAVETLTEYPSILGGRVKTLHPKVFGGILARREDSGDSAQLAEYAIPEFDLVVVDLYPFEQTLAETKDPHGSGQAAIIEKIDIGGISLIRAAAKNYRDVLVCASREQYGELLDILRDGNGESTLRQRQRMACLAFEESSHYDTAIQHWFREGLTAHPEKGVPANGGETAEPDPVLTLNIRDSRPLRYGENPHQKARYYGRLQDGFEQLHGKELSYNNLVDLDAAVALIAEFRDNDPTFAILKHTNPCGLATRPTLAGAYLAALAGDPVSAFGGVLIANRPIDVETAAQIHELFCELVVAPGYAPEALAMLSGKKNRMLLKQKQTDFGNRQFRSLLGGVLLQETDHLTETAADFTAVTERHSDPAQLRDMVFANKVVKHLKSNAIALVSGEQLIGIGHGQTSRIDALQQAIAKAHRFQFDTTHAVLASDAFFPFADGVEQAYAAGIRTVVQPGGSIKDQDSIDFCNRQGMAMVFTGKRHFRH